MAILSSFPQVPAVLDLKSAKCKSNREAWKPVLEQFEASLKEVSGEGDAKSLSRQQKRSQLLGMEFEASVTRKILISILARDRIALLLDDDSPFLELGSFAGFGSKDSNANANLITGIGSVS